MCQSPPIGSTYYPALFSTILVYLLGLQSWPIWPICWFLSYYSWFSSSYYTCVFMFPRFYKFVYKFRGKSRQLWCILGTLLAANYIALAAFLLTSWPTSNDMGGFRNVSSINFTSFEWTSQSSYFPLTFYMFPPLWFLVFASGVCAAFLYDHYRPAERYSNRYWGYVLDFLRRFFSACRWCYNIARRYATFKCVGGAIAGKDMGGSILKAVYGTYGVVCVRCCRWAWCRCRSTPLTFSAETRRCSLFMLPLPSTYIVLVLVDYPWIYLIMVLLAL